MILFVYCFHNLKHKGMKIMKSLIVGKNWHETKKIHNTKEFLRGKKNSENRTKSTLVRMKMSLRSETENFVAEHSKHLANVANMRLRLFRTQCCHSLDWSPFPARFSSCSFSWFQENFPVFFFLIHM